MLISTGPTASLASPAACTRYSLSCQRDSAGQLSMAPVTTTGRRGRSNCAAKAAGVREAAGTRGRLSACSQEGWGDREAHSQDWNRKSEEKLGTCGEGGGDIMEVRGQGALSSLPGPCGRSTAGVGGGGRTHRGEGYHGDGGNSCRLFRAGCGVLSHQWQVMHDTQA